VREHQPKAETIAEPGRTAMHRDSGAARFVARALLTSVFVVTLGAGAPALAQDATPLDDAAVASGTDAAAAADQPRRGRERRRAAEAADETRPPEPAAAPATLPTYNAATASVAQAAETIEAKMVCKNRKITGTKISRRICGTPEQWAAQQQRTTDDAQEAMRQVRERSSIVVTQPSQQAPTGLGGAN
jgi:hypothetical protein